MPRKPAPSAYFLATILRQTVRLNDERVALMRQNKENLERWNASMGENLRLPIATFTETVYWSDIYRNMDMLKKARESLRNIPDKDYRAIIGDCLKSSWNKVRQSKGFQALVPDLQTLRRYGPVNPDIEMKLTEEEARDLADLIWSQEMEPFAENGLDPINKQIIANKVARELAQENVKYLGEEIVSVVFNDVELDIWEKDNTVELEMLRAGAGLVFNLFDYDPAAPTETNTRHIRQQLLIYNSIFEKEMEDEELDDLVFSLHIYFAFLVKLTE